MLLLIACADETDSAAPAPSGWAEPFVWSLAEPVPCPEPSADDTVGQLAAAVGFEFPFGIPDDRFTGVDKDDDTRLDWYSVADVTALPCFGRNHVARADAAVLSDHPLAATVADGAAILGWTLSVGGTLASTPVEGDTAAVPDPILAAAATLLGTIDEVIPLRDAAIEAMMPDGKPNHAFDDGASYLLTQVGDGLDPNDADYHGLFLGDDRMYTAAVRLAQAVDEAVLSASTVDFHFQMDTAYGAVILNGGADDTYDGTPTLLVIDAGGNDTWSGPSGATASQDNPVSIAIDLAGDDTYTYDGTSSGVDGVLPDDEDGRYYDSATNGPYSLSSFVRQGAGVLGIGFLVDLGGGDDQYQSLRRSQGYAQFGVGILYDDGGDDVYEGEAGVQGAACVGIAALIDRGGADRYTSWTASQGFAWMSSAAMLHDADGDDAYELVPDDPMLYYSDQTMGATNNNLGQGAGFGMRREDSIDLLSGGVALLRDAGGDDRYAGATYVQGVGYQMGTGILADAAGNDGYQGVFYAQGAGVHFGVGMMLEDAGDDSFVGTMASTAGLGHDSGVGLLIDVAGNDTYDGADRAIGAGKCHGLGLLVDRAGDDAYTLSNDRGIGWATDYDVDAGDCGADKDVATWGLFVDLDGVDTYTKVFGGQLGDDTQWTTDDPGGNGALQLSGGLDTTGGDSFAR